MWVEMEVKGLILTPRHRTEKIQVLNSKWAEEKLR